MAIMYKLKNKITIVLVFLVAIACKEECLDVNLINENTTLLETWFTDDAIESKTLTSSINITEEVALEHDFYDHGDSIWDDCGNVSQSFRSLVTYDFFNFPLYLETELSKQGEENGFEFRVKYNFDYEAYYKFVGKQTSSKNPVELLLDYEVNNQIYSEVLKVNFNQTQNENDIKTLYFVKMYGIVRIELNNGISIVLD